MEDFLNRTETADFNSTGFGDITANESGLSPQNLSGVSPGVLEIWFIVNLVISVTGAVFGFLLLLVMFLQHSSGSMLLLFHLVAVELVLTGFPYPAQNFGTFHVLQGKPVGLSCGPFMLIYVMFSITGYCNTFALAFVRVLAATSTPKYRRCTTKKAVSGILVTCWIIGIGLNAIPYAISNGTFFGYTPPFGDCGTIFRTPTYTSAFMIIGIVLPVTGVVAIYVVLLLALAAKSRKFKPEIAPTAEAASVYTAAVRRVTFSAHGTVADALRQRASQARRRATFTRVLFASSLWNAICFLPVPLFILVNPTAFFTDLMLQLWLRALNLLGYALNPDLMLPWIVVSLVLCAMGGTSGLVLLVVIVLQHPHLPRSILLLFHLVAIEFLVCAVFYPVQNMTTYRTMRGNANDLNCGAFMASYISFYMTGYFNAIALAAARFLAATSNRAYQLLTTRSVLLGNIALCWLLGLGLNVIPYVLSPTNDRLFRSNPPFNDCGSTSTVSTFTPIWMFAGNLLPVIGQVVLYIVILIVTEARDRRMRSVLPVPAAPNVLQVPPGDVQDGKARRHPKTQAQRRAKFTRVLFVSSLWSAICFLPIPLMMATNPIAFYMSIPLQLWIRTFQLSGYAFNPLIFLVLNQDYRKCALQILKGQWRQRSSVSMAMASYSKSKRQATATH